MRHGRFTAQSYLFVHLSLFVVCDSDPPLVYAEQKNKCEKCGEAASLSEPITGLGNVQDDDVDKDLHAVLPA